MSWRQLAHQALNFFMIIGSALMIWKGLSVATNSESPIVVVLSESMEPAFQRGDLLFLSMFSDPIRVGDICVFKIEGKQVPIVHRVIEIHDETKTGQQYILTKGDNNRVDDRGLYNPHQMWIREKDVVGRVKGFLPYVGMITIVLNDYPQLKVLLLVVLVSKKPPHRCCAMDERKKKLEALAAKRREAEEKAEAKKGGGSGGGGGGSKKSAAPSASSRGGGSSKVSAKVLNKREEELEKKLERDMQGRADDYDEGDGFIVGSEDDEGGGQLSGFYVLRTRCTLTHLVLDDDEDDDDDDSDDGRSKRKKPSSSSKSKAKPPPKKQKKSRRDASDDEDDEDSEDDGASKGRRKKKEKEPKKPKKKRRSGGSDDDEEDEDEDDLSGLDTSVIIKSAGRTRASKGKVDYAKFGDGEEDEEEDD
ncbi:Signal peptidase complex catalytic subunit S11A [Irineochytrium annulatum]|nr:Signal peptidase complex catalytic subunit S11A [Irineochytrium annulatum]